VLAGLRATGHTAGTHPQVCLLSVVGGGVCLCVCVGGGQDCNRLLGVCVARPQGQVTQLSSRQSLWATAWVDSSSGGWAGGRGCNSVRKQAAKAHKQADTYPHGKKALVLRALHAVSQVVWWSMSIWCVMSHVQDTCMRRHACMYPMRHCCVHPSLTLPRPQVCCGQAVCAGPV
jgi:hypothetical protein